MNEIKFQDNKSIQQIKEALSDRMEFVIPITGNPIYVSDTMSSILIDAKAKRIDELGSTTNGSRYLSLIAEIQFINTLLEDMHCLK